MPLVDNDSQWRAIQQAFANNSRVKEVWKAWLQSDKPIRKGDAARLLKAAEREAFALRIAINQSKEVVLNMQEASRKAAVAALDEPTEAFRGRGGGRASSGSRCPSTNTG